MAIKEPAQIALAIAMGIFALAYSYFDLVIAPIERSSLALKKQLQKTDETIENLTVELRKLNYAEANDQINSELDALSDQLIQSIPPTHLVSCPNQISGLLKSHGIQGAKVRLASILPCHALPKTFRDIWSISIPSTDARQIGEVIADIENHFPLGQAISLSMTSNGANSNVSVDIKLLLIVFQ